LDSSLFFYSEKFAIGGKLMQSLKAGFEEKLTDKFFLLYCYFLLELEKEIGSKDQFFDIVLAEEDTFDYMEKYEFREKFLNMEDSGRLETKKNGIRND
jgi:hypothetical protein